ncbi:MAG: YceD family protein [Buchananella hordeovulneris]|nr:YceD family protein [Buchananella hordeovulneris]
MVNPYAISIHDLGRSPGAMRDYHLHTVAKDMHTVVAGVPDGTELDLDVTLTQVSDGVLAQVRADVEIKGACVRCLRDFATRTHVDATEMFFNPGTRAAALAEGDEEADEMLEIEGTEVNLEPVVRDAIVLDLPFDPLCEDDCPGLCPECGVALRDAEPGHGHEVIDPRWAALGGLNFGQGEAGQ